MGWLSLSVPGRAPPALLMVEGAGRSGSSRVAGAGGRLQKGPRVGGCRSWKGLFSLPFSRPVTRTLRPQGSSVQPRQPSQPWVQWNCPCLPTLSCWLTVGAKILCFQLRKVSFLQAAVLPAPDGGVRVWGLGPCLSGGPWAVRGQGTAPAAGVGEGEGLAAWRLQRRESGVAVGSLGPACVGQAFRGYVGCPGRWRWSARSSGPGFRACCRPRFRFSRSCRPEAEWRGVSLWGAALEGVIFRPTRSPAGR